MFVHICAKLRIFYNIIIMLIIVAFPLASVLLSIILLSLAWLSGLTRRSTPWLFLSHDASYTDSCSSSTNGSDVGEVKFFEEKSVATKHDHLAKVFTAVRKRNILADAFMLMGGSVSFFASVWECYKLINATEISQAYWKQIIAGNIICWLYITAISIVRLRHKITKLLLSLRFHQLFLIVVAYASLFLGHVWHQRQLIITGQLEWSSSAALLMVGMQFALLGAFLSQGVAKEASSGRIVTLENIASILDCILFTWIGPLLSIGAKRRLEDCDMWDLPKREQANIISHIYRRISCHSILRGIILVSRFDIACQVAFAVLWSGSLYAIPYFMYCLLSNIANPDEISTVLPWVYMIGMLLAMISSGIFYQQAHFIGQRLRVRSRTLIMDQLFQKCLNKPPCNPQSSIPIHDKSTEASTVDPSYNSQLLSWDADIITCMIKTETEDISEALGNIHTGVGGVIQIILAAIFLWNLIGTSMLFGLAGICVITAFIGILSIVMTRIYSNLLTATNNRKICVQEALRNIYNIRLLAWEKLILRKINQARNEELDALWHRQLTYAGFIMATRGGPAIIGSCALGGYTLFLQQKLDASTAFTCLILFELLASAIIQLPDIIYWCSQCGASNKKITAFLSQQETMDVAMSDYMDIRERNDRVAISDGEFSWYQQEEIEWNIESGVVITRTNFSLTSIHIEFKLNKLNIITGGPSSGKTSLLMALLDEMPRNSGTVFLPKNRRVYENYGTPNSSIAFVAQKPWIRNASIRDNILFGRLYDEIRYTQVLQACALEFDIDNLYAGDETILGDNGIKLLLSQEQRISLARAVYSQAKHLIIDDCFTALEPALFEHIANNCLLGPLMCDRTCILVTNQLELFEQTAVFAVLLKSGHVAAKGPPMMVLEHMKNMKTTPFDIVDGLSLRSADSVVVVDYPIYSVARKADNIPKEKAVQPEEVPTPNTALDKKCITSYKMYLSAAGSINSWIFALILVLICQAAIIYQLYWLRIWVTDVDNNQHSKFYFGIYALLTATSVMAIGIPAAYLYAMGIKTGETMHNRLISSIMHANMKLFDTTPVDVLLRRLFQQSIVVDQELPINITSLVGSVVTFLGYLVVAIIAVPVFTPVALLLVVWHYYAARYYLRTSYYLKKLTVNFKSDFLLLLNEVLRDPVTIRVSGIQERLTAEGERLIDAMSRPAYLQAAASQWMLNQARMASVFAVWSTISLMLLSLDTIDASLFGFVVVCMLIPSLSINGMIEHMTKVGEDTRAIKFIAKYLQITQESAKNTGAISLSVHWPNQGAIEIQTLSSMKTGNSYLPVHSLSISIGSGERVGIYGRTSTERFSLPAALLRLIESSDGHLFIDGVDISKVSLYDLRSRVTFISNKPILLSGTLRSNLDPFGRHEDTTICDVLYRCHLINDDESAVLSRDLRNLDLEVEENDPKFSMSERRLLAVAQAILRNNKVVIVDESMTDDPDTDAQLQQIVHSEFKNATMLLISPQPHLAVDYDHILVFDEDRPAEWDTPANLIYRQNSNFHAICQRFGDIELLKAMALNKPKPMK
ncbi:hypothetical protein BDF19DRAFT_19704 [Syncephalis fuscata]|nr:hypothetical protein BDF19DRAFT_19704 [Syncephalis fuscata]